jgi:hypothetical protein
MLISQRNEDYFKWLLVKKQLIDIHYSIICQKISLLNSKVKISVYLCHYKLKLNKRL